MDPASIITLTIGLSKTLYNVSQLLCSFTQAARSVDESLRRLHGELTDLGRTLPAVSRSLSHPAIQATRYETSENQQLLIGAAESLIHCRDTIDGLAEVLRGVPPSGKRKGFFQRAYQQVQLNLVENQVKEFRTQIATHVRNVQLLLTSLDLCEPPFTFGLVSMLIILQPDQFKLPRSNHRSLRTANTRAAKSSPGVHPL